MIFNHVRFVHDHPDAGTAVHELLRQMHRATGRERFGADDQEFKTPIGSSVPLLERFGLAGIQYQYVALHRAVNEYLALPILASAKLSDYQDPVHFAVHVVGGKEVERRFGLARAHVHVKRECVLVPRVVQPFELIWPGRGLERVDRWERRYLARAYAVESRSCNRASIVCKRVSIKIPEQELAIST